MSSATLQNDPSVESFFNAVETETLALFEHLSFEFLEEFDVFAPAETGRTQDLEPSKMMRGFLHRYYKDIYGSVRLRENSTTHLFGLGVSSIDRRQETRSIASSPILNMLLTKSSSISSSRPPCGACST